MIDEMKFRSLLSKIENIYNEYYEAQEDNGGSFNLCSILRKDNDEVNLHSKLIYEIINPNGSHCQKDLFLKLFIEEALEITDFNSTNLSVFREDLTTNLDRNRQIDFVIESSNYIIGIEMKIDARDQDKQLYDYHNELKSRQKKTKKNKKMILFYLTKYGTAATDESLGSLTNKSYSCLSFSIDIDWWLDKCIEKTKVIKLKESMTQYQDIVKKITGQIPEEIEEEMDKLINGKKDIEFIHSLMQDYPKVWAKKEYEFWNDLCLKIRKINFKNINDNSSSIEVDFFGSDKNYRNSDINVKTIEKYRHMNGTGYFGLDIILNLMNNRFNILIAQYNNGPLFIEIMELGPKGAIKNNNKLFQLLEKFNYVKSNDGGFDQSKTNKSCCRKNILDDFTFYAFKTINPSFELFEEDNYKEYLSEATKEIKKVILLIEKNTVFICE